MMYNVRIQHISEPQDEKYDKPYNKAHFLSRKFSMDRKFSENISC